MLPVYLKIFDEKLLFTQGTDNASQSIPLYTIFTGQATLCFCLVEGDERKKSWYRIVHLSGRTEDEPFAEINVACHDGVITVSLTPGSGTLQQIGDIGKEFARMYREGDHTGILGIGRGCKDPEVFEQACETQKLVFSEDKEIQAICDNAEHRLTAKYRPPPPPVQKPLKFTPEPGSGSSGNKAVFSIARALAYASVAMIVLVAVICTLIMIYMYWTGGRPVIEIMR